MSAYINPFLLTIKNPYFLCMSLIRAAGSLAILWSPVIGFSLTCLLDILDSYVILRISKATRQEYQFWDKNTDWFTYIVMLTVGASYGLFLPLFILLFLRFGGQFMFMRTHKTGFFLVFPNYFEAVFLWTVIFNQPGDKIEFSNYHIFWLMALLVTKQVQEMALYIGHVFKME